MSQDPLPQRRVVVVLGFHRSGTSMVTRMLNLLGVDLGDEEKLLPPEERDNERGYWEPRWMIELNEEILATLGTSTFAPFQAEPGWGRAPELEPLRERARTLLAEHFADVPVWGWKDPRTSLTLPFWRTVVDEPMSCVVCVRSPADAVASALKRGIVDLHRWSYAERWLEYTALALSHTAPEERILVFYEDALRDPAGETRRLAAFLGIDEPAPERLEASVASVDPELRHHTTSPLDVAVDPGLPVETRALYLLLRARRNLESGASASDGRMTQALERVGVDLRGLYLDRVAAQNAEHLARHELELRGERLRDAEQEIGRVVGETERLAGELRARDDDVASLSARREAEVAERDATIAELHRVIAERDAAIATYANSLSWKITRPLRKLAARIRGSRG